MRVNSARLIDIAEQFNAAGIPTPGGGRHWYESHVSRLLRTRTGEAALAAAARAMNGSTRRGGS
jgi:hypothetical protein